jgi:photosystem II stability/assembly factor-like uncharacterized protein
VAKRYLRPPSNEVHFGGVRLLSSHRITRIATVLGFAVVAILVSVGAVGAIDAIGSHAAHTVIGDTSIPRWVVPHGQGSAPVIPVSGGAAQGHGGFNGISCPTPNECVAVGADGSLGGVASTSRDGGNSFTQGAMAVGAPALLAIDCPSAVVCVAVGRGGSVKSSNAGSSWTSVSIASPNTTLLSVSCPSVHSCFSVGVSPGSNGPFSGQLLSSRDGGSTWTSLNLPASIGALGSVDCPSTTFCVAVGASIVVSTDGGTTWSARGVNGGTGVLRSVSCLSITTCVAVGPNPSVAQNLQSAAFEVLTTDGGTTWNPVSMPASSAMLNVVTCARGSNCEAAGSTIGPLPSRILTSSDGGASWSSPPSLTNVLTAISAVSCESATACVYVGTKDGRPVVVGTSGSTVTNGQQVSQLVRTQKDVLR